MEYFFKKLGRLSCTHSGWNRNLILNGRKKREKTGFIKAQSQIFTFSILFLCICLNNWLEEENLLGEMKKNIFFFRKTYNRWKIIIGSKCRIKPSFRPSLLRMKTSFHDIYAYEGKWTFFSCSNCIFSHNCLLSLHFPQVEILVFKESLL